jgi:hypothetical protein
MTSEIQERSTNRFIPWLLFLGSLVGVSGSYIIPALLGHSFWEPVSSGSARNCLLVSVILFFVCCCAAPFFSSLRPSMKFAAAFGAAIAFILVMLLALGVSAWVGPRPTNWSAIAPNQSIPRMGASCLVPLQIASPWRLAPTADARR